MSLSLEVCVLPPVFPSQHRTTAIHPRSLALTQKRPKQHVDACLPITGLKALVLSNNGDRLVLQGQGPYSRLIDEQSGRLLAELRTFKRNNVHGFLVFRQCLLEADEKKEYVHVLCWGGQSLRVIDLVVSIQEGTTEASLIPATAEYLAPDWILSGCVPSSSIDYYVKGSVAAVARVCLVTAHNALLDLQVEDMESSKYRKGIRLQQLETGVKSILYSADSVSLSPTHILVAAGTVFGEIIVWSCFLDDLKNTDGGDAVSSSSIHHFFTGHEGSIFGVEISPNIPALHGSQSGRLLASCSDDRTVRIWDISDCERTSRDEPSAYATDGFELRSTGFGCVPATDSLGSESCVAKAFGHEARIWGAHFLPLTMYNRGCRLISCGEDVACILWDLNWEESPSGADNFRLQQRSSFHQHSGKHIWSLDKCSVGVDTIVYTGGADGALKTSWISGNKTGEVKDEGRKGKASVIPTNDQAETDSRLRTFSFIASDCFLAISLSGEVKLGWIGSGMTKTESGMKPDITWETICVEKDLCSFSIISALPEKRMALLSNIQGLIRLYDHRSKSLFTVAQAERPQEIHFLLPKSDSSSADVPDTLYFVTYNPVADETKLFKVGKWQTETPHVEQFTLALLPPFWASCASFICGKQYIALGSRGGAFVIYRFPDSGQSEQPLQPLISLRRVHGKASINLIMSIASFHDDHGMLREYILTCGRDGAYCLHEIQTTNDPTKPVMLTTIHRSSSPITDIERVYFDKTSRDLILYGFRGREFVLWNESTQSEIASIECGGIRRSWAFHPGATDTASRGLFLWNKTSDFNAQFIQSRSHRVLRAGGHGREIKCMAVCNHAKSDGGALFATGAEDTAVRIWALTDSCVEGPWGIFKCLRVTNKHTSGLQQISWSNDGKYLFTSGGWEEFFVWRIRSIPVFGATAELLASSPKDDERSDLRVTSFDMLDVEEQGTDQSSFLFCLTYSNSTIKIFHFSPFADQGHFTLLAKGTYMSNCLTQVRFLRSSSSLNMITAATDGYATLWNLTPVLEPFYSISPQKSVLSTKQPFRGLEVTPATISCENRYQMHSNSIKSLELARVSDTASVIIAGGDDNGLTISLLRNDSASTETETKTEPENYAHVTTVSIPDAHAASITTTKLIRQKQIETETGNKRTDILFASSGNDHRVKIWSVHVDHEKDGPEGIEIRMDLDRYSPVADIASMDVVDEDASGSRLLVCGVGMEAMSMTLP